MNAKTFAEFVSTLREHELLTPRQLKELDGSSATQAGSPEELGGSLVVRGWLTGYQAREVLDGRGGDLALGKYRLLEPLGEGGMGQVFKARHLLMGRVVAVKLIRPDFISHPEAIHRFRREIKAAAALRHPNIVTAYDAEQVGTRHFLVMEFCEGITLAELVRQAGPLASSAACDYVRQAALGLQHAFERGWVHRDVKPENLLVSGSTVKILDLGLARLRPTNSGNQLTAVTRAGAILGTPDFMAPEQTVPKGEADIRSDLYSLGCTFYFLLAGRVPFPGGTLVEKCLRHRSEAPAPLESRRPDVPPAVREVVRRLMEKNPAVRYQTPAELAAVLQPFCNAAPAPPRTRLDGIALPSLATGPAPTYHAPVSTRPELRPAPRIAAPEPDRTVRAAAPKRRQWLPWAAVCAVLALGLCALLALVGAWGMRDHGWQGAPTGTNGVVRSSARRWQPSKTLPLPRDNEILALSFSPNGELLVGGCGMNDPNKPLVAGCVRVWDVASGRDIATDSCRGPSLGVAFSPGGETLAWGVGHWNHVVPGDVTLYDVALRKKRKTFVAHEEGTYCLAYQPRGSLLATGGRDKEVRLWDGGSGRRIGELTGCTGAVVALAFAPGGDQLAAACKDGSVRLWEVASRKDLGPLPGPSGKLITALVWSPDGETLLASTRVRQNAADGGQAEVLAWNGRDHRRAPAFAVLTSSIICMSFTPDGGAFLVGCQDGSVRQYDVATRQELKGFKLDISLSALAFSPGGHLAIGGGWDQPVQLWEGVK